MPRLATVIAATLCIAGCSGRSIPKAAGGAVGTPRIGWVIMMGDRDNPDREFVCYSDVPGDCVMPASRPNQPVFADVHLYYHSTPAETKYSGTVQIGFFSSPHELRPDFTVRAGAGAANQSVAGIVSDKPGTYAMTIAVDATGAEPGGSRQIREQVRAIVR